MDRALIGRGAMLPSDILPFLGIKWLDSRALFLFVNVKCSCPNYCSDIASCLKVKVLKTQLFENISKSRSVLTFLELQSNISKIDHHGTNDSSGSSMDAWRTTMMV